MLFTPMAGFARDRIRASGWQTEVVQAFGDAPQEVLRKRYRADDLAYGVRHTSRLQPRSSAEMRCRDAHETARSLTQPMPGCARPLPPDVISDRHSSPGGDAADCLTQAGSRRRREDLQFSVNWDSGSSRAFRRVPSRFGRRASPARVGGRRCHMPRVISGTWPSTHRPAHLIT